MPTITACDTCSIPVLTNAAICAIPPVIVRAADIEPDNVVNADATVVTDAAIADSDTPDAISAVANAMEADAAVEAGAAKDANADAAGDTDAPILENAAAILCVADPIVADDALN